MKFPLRSRLVKSEPLTPSVRGQEFFPVDLGELPLVGDDGIFLGYLYAGMANLARSGVPPRSQLLQDAFAVGIVDALALPRRFLEIGGGPPIDHSNTASLEELGWSGIVVEPNPRFAPLYEQHRSSSTRLVRAAIVGSTDGATEMTLVEAGELSYVSESVTPPNDVWSPLRQEAIREGRSVQVTVLSAEQLWADILLEDPLPSFVSIDIEGGELPILEQLPSTSLRPAVVCAESSGDMERVQALDTLMLGRGYQRVLSVASKWDNWYVAAEHIPTLRGQAGP